MKVIKLDIDEENEFEGIDAVALVEAPAIELDFQFFNKQSFAKTFNDYPKKAIADAKQGIKRNKAIKNKCATAVGKQRAQQLANGENLSLTTIKRMRSFLLRQKENYDLAVKRSDYNACGYISYLLWGGPAALPWAEKKLRQAGMLEASNKEVIMTELGYGTGIKRKKSYNKFVSQADGFKVGDFVSFGFAGKTKDKSRSRGQIKDIRVEGTVKIPGSSFEFKPTKDNPLALIKLADGKTVGQYTKGLRKINKPKDFADQAEIDGIPVFDNENAALVMARNIGCSGTHKHELAGTTVYMPCKTHTEATDKMLKKIDESKPLEFHEEKHFDNLDDSQKEQLLKSLKSVGKEHTGIATDGWVEITEDEFNNSLYAEFAVKRSDSNPDKGSLQDTSQFKVLYKYTGPRDSKNRTFCRQVLNLDLLYRLEDINKMSLFGANEEFSTYDIFSYKGSYNCRHSWQQKFFKRNDENNERAKKNPLLEELVGGPRAQQAAQNNPKSRTQTEVEAGIPEGQFQFKAVQDKMELAGPLMIPDKLIPRFDEDGEKYYVFFDAAGIKKLSYKLMENKLIDSVNIEHDPDRKVADLSLVESWLVSDPENDKSNSYGYKLAKGSWFGIYRVNNNEVWDKYIKTGKVKGFSVEGIFNDKTILNSKQEYAFA